MHQEYCSLLENDEKLADEEWFEEVDERVFTVKHKVYNWLKEAETELSSNKLYSRKGSKSMNSGSSGKTNIVIVVAEVDAPRKEPWRKMQSWLR